MTPRELGQRTFASLQRHRNYRLWFVGQVTSLTGTWVQSVAMAWFVLSVTHSGVATGVLIACQFTPYLLFGLFGGGPVDRYDNRRLLMGTQIAYLVVAAALTVLGLMGKLSVPVVDLAALANGLIQVLDTPARQAFTVQMVGKDELPNAIALNTSLFNTSRALGPAIGGVLLATTSVTVCFGVNALSFLAVLLALAMMRPAELRAPLRSAARTGRGLRAGIEFAWRDRDVRTVLALLLVVGTLGMNFQVLLPVLAKTTIHGGPATYGWLSAAFGGGAIIGALISASRTRPTWRVLLTAGAIYSSALLVLATATTLWAAVAALAICGAGFAVYASSSNATIQLRTPDQLRGRVMAIFGYLFLGTTPIGSLFAGWLADRSTALAFSVTGAVCLVAVVAAVALRKDTQTNPVAAGRITVESAPAGVRD